MFDEPRPRENYSEVSFDWALEFPLELLPAPPVVEDCSIFAVLSKRVSRRSFERLRLEDLSNILWHTSKTYEVKSRQPGPDWEHRPLPSAGGCHVVRIIVVRKSEEGFSAAIYDSRAHGLRALPTSMGAQAIYSEVSSVIPVEAGTVLLLAIDSARLNCRYENWESLAWRDSGIVSAGISLVATALGLSCCIVGCTGRSSMKTIPNVELVAAGAIILGGLQDPSERT
jgi:SagB-type dehydrogenase family enzyme